MLVQCGSFEKKIALFYLLKMTLQVQQIAKGLAVGEAYKILF